jgi:hypothetical protein
MCRKAQGSCKRAGSVADLLRGVCAWLSASEVVLDPDAQAIMLIVALDLMVD